MARVLVVRGRGFILVFALGNPYCPLNPPEPSLYRLHNSHKPCRAPLKPHSLLQAVKNYSMGSLAPPLGPLLGGQGGEGVRLYYLSCMNMLFKLNWQPCLHRTWSSHIIPVMFKEGVYIVPDPYISWGVHCRDYSVTVHVWFPEYA